MNPHVGQTAAAGQDGKPGRTVERPAPASTDGQFAARADELLSAPANAPAPRRRIAIVSTMRSGSSYFCSALNSTGRFGRPQEYFNPRFLDVLRRRLGGPLPAPDDYITMLAARTTTPNGVFTVHFHVDHYTKLKQSSTDLLDGRFDLVLAVRRDDALAQGLSYAKAMLSDRWNSLAVTARRVTAADVSDSCLLAALATITAWKEFYAARMRDRVHHEYRYEDFAADPTLFRRVLDDCGIEHADIAAFDTPLTVQREPADTARIERFLSTFGLIRA